MNECINWESVIPNFQKGDIITPFESAFQKQRHADFIVDGGMNHRDTLEKYASVRRKNSQKEGVYSQDGQQILPEEFDKCEPEIYNSGDFYISVIRVKRNGVEGLYKKNGQIIVPVRFAHAYIQDYVAIVRDTNRLYGAYSLSGKQIIDCEYDNIEFSGSLDEGYGCAIICKGGIYGAKLEDGTDIIPLKYGRIQQNIMGGGGYIVHDVENRKLCGWYSRDGKNSIPCIFKSIQCNYKEIKVETPDGLKGIYSNDGIEIVPTKFESINCIGNYIVELIGKDKLSVYDRNGNCLYCTEE